MKKLELKHLAPYLPYGLKVCSANAEIYSSTNIWELEGIVRGNVYLQELTYPADIFRIKPILRPLIDLVKLIIIDGVSFIPMEALLKEKQTYRDEKTGYEITSVYKVVSINHKFYDLAGRPTNHYQIDYLEEYTNTQSQIHRLIYDDSLSRFQHRVITPYEDQLGLSYKELHLLLLEWHFDVFGLIPAGLAIDINTI